MHKLTANTDGLTEVAASQQGSTDLEIRAEQISTAAMGEFEPTFVKEVGNSTGTSKECLCFGLRIVLAMILVAGYCMHLRMLISYISIYADLCYFCA